MTTYRANQLPYPPTARRPKVNPWFIRLPLLGFTGGLLVVLALTVLIAMFHMSYSDRITPGVSAFGVNLSGMTPQQAAAALEREFIFDDSAVVTFRDGDQVWQLSAGELGVGFDAEATVAQAMSIGAHSNPFIGLLDQSQAWFSGADVAPIVRYNQDMAVQQLNAIAAQIERTPTDAALAVSGTEVTVTPGRPGRSLDVYATLARLNPLLMNLHTGGEVELVINETAPVVWNVDEAANQLRAALSGPLQIIADGPDGQRLGPWTASVEQIAPMLRLQRVDQPNGTATYAVSADVSAMEAFIAGLAPGLLSAPRDGRFHFNETTGQLEVIQPAINGRKLNVEKTLAALETAVFRFDQRVVPVEFDYTLPTYHNNITAAELGITQLVGEATTYYTGSTANRRHNIAEGASRFDGVIIGPGEEFSFNTLLGELSPETGFVEAKVIEGERTVDGIGGGICQVSTTAFRAAFFGGFPIIERNSHAYRVGFYELNAPPGLDAAIWTPERDMRFQNDTDYHLLIETAVYPANNALQFRLYSTNPGRTVEILEPTVRNVVPALPTRYEANSDLQPGQVLQVDWAAEGADVNVKRIIRDSSGNEIRQDNIFTHYLPWRAIYQVAPGDTRLNS
jgi:vancomycin resistance protein YoaR